MPPHDGPAEPARAPLTPWTQRLLRIAPPQVFVVLLMTAIVSVVIFAVSETTSSRITAIRSQVRDTYEAMQQAALVRQGVLGAESAQRGYLLVGSSAYLGTFESSSSMAQNALSALAPLAGDDLEVRARVESLREHVMAKIDELKFTVRLLREGNRERALAEVASGQGLALMRTIERSLDELEPILRAEGQRRTESLDDVWLQLRVGVGIVVLLNLAFLAVLANLMIRQFTQREIHRSDMQRHAESLERTVAERTEELSALSSYLQSSTERDKARLARDLHDELGGILTSAKIDIAWLEGHNKSTDPDAASRLRRLSMVLDEAVDLKRRVVENLRPSLLDHLGLGPALEWYITENCRKAGIDPLLTLPDMGEPLPPEMSIAIYRLVQEGLTNTIKYAKATMVEVRVERVEAGEGREHDGYRLLQSDDGVGIKDFRRDHLSHGMAGMRQRARALGGSFEVRTEAGEGTTIEAYFPLKPMGPEALTA